MDLSPDSLPALVPTRARADGWTAEKQRAFLENLAACGSVSGAARSVGMSRESAYALRRRAEGRGFAQAWDAARLLATEHLVEVAWDRALNGVVRPIWYHGELVGEVVHHDSRLLLGLIAQNRRLAAEQGAGQGHISPLASGAVVSGVLGDWDAALERVERGEALEEPAPEPEPGPVAAEQEALPVPAGREEAIPPPLPVEYEHGEKMDEAQALEIGTYGHWWDEGLDCWLTNWPAPAGWSGRLYTLDALGEADEEWSEGSEIEREDCVRTLTPEEEEGLERGDEGGEAARAARLELYRKACFGLAGAAELAALAAVNSGRTDWRRGAGRLTFDGNRTV